MVNVRYFSREIRTDGDFDLTPQISGIFCINFSKYYISYFDIRTIWNKKFNNYKVVDLVEYFKFDINLVSISEVVW